ncbi:hypothetical protein CCUS01_14100 [Colletotrichum cuscutae]|uniref:Uncharacterized protein n=1 Tax=Colletotrichum cuscutae TaxID=1209917 RepID=A0AAI9YA62_9PEZI|nr:hypothetical protein CCUS01_14100 [Colletotrichum cuscutae]
MEGSRQSPFPDPLRFISVESMMSGWKARSMDLWSPAWRWSSPQSTSLITIDLNSFTGKVNFTGSYSTALQPLIDVGPIATNFSRNTFAAEASKAMTPEFLAVYTHRIGRGNINMKADQELYKEVSELFFSYYASSTLADHTIGFSWHPVTPHAVQESDRKGGNTGDWQEVNQNCQPVAALNLRTSWGNVDDNAAAL